MVRCDYITSTKTQARDVFWFASFDNQNSSPRLDTAIYLGHYVDTVSGMNVIKGPPFRIHIRLHGLMFEL